MDGTLSESESGELLHSLSVSPEKRVVLEQHIKLRELTSLAQKPTAVPQALEASMAERFPAIASYNREIAGGALVASEAARQGFLGKMAASVASFIGQYPIRTGFAVVAASVIGYFAIRGNEKGDISSAVDQTDRTVVTDRTYTQPSNTNAVSSTESNSTNTVPAPVKNSAGAQTNSLSHRPMISNTDHSASRSQNHGSTNTMSVKKDLKNISVANNGNPSKSILPPNPEKEIERQAMINERNAKLLNKDSKDIALAGTDVKNQETSEAERVPELAMISSVKDIRSEPTLVAPKNNVGNRVQQNPFRMREEHSGGIPFAIRAYGTLGQSFVNVNQNDKSLTNRTEGSFLGGIDYIFNPYFSLGVEGGPASISHLTTQTAVQSDAGGSPSISRVVVNNVISNGSQMYGRLMARYTVNPYDLVRWELSGGVGAAFAATTSPLASVMFAGGFDITENIGMSLGVSFAGAWTKADPQSVQAEPMPSSDPVGYVTVNHAATTLFTPSYSIRAGLKLKLW